ncbi:MAG: branched-chain amino acid transport system substrate-binding protein [Rhodospirillaceae bacterium]|nr:MAG: branched-chain amino acid transport system substrate-binding protein [Rhodospirillaceae bacterium]
MDKSSVLITATALFVLMMAKPGQADITIAVVGPMTGPTAAFGEQMRRGAEAAVRDINKAGGVLGQRIKLEIGDDACDARQAVAVANQMVNKRVALIAGHFCSGSSIPASDVYHEEGLLQISPGSTNPQLTDRGYNTVFRTCGRDDQQGKVAGNYLVAHFKDKKIAIVHDQQAYSKGLADETKKALNAAGVTEILYETLTPGEKDYSALVTKLKTVGTEMVFYGGYPHEAGLIVRQMRDQGMKTVLMGGDALVAQEFWQITGPAGEGTLMTFSPDPRKIPGNAELVARFHKEGYDPEAYTFYTYGTIQTWKQAVEKVASTDVKAVVGALRQHTFDTVLGPIRFDAKGDITESAYVVYKWSNGTYDYVQP